MTIGCQHCKEVCIVSRIRTPLKLKRAISVIKANLADGTIVESKYWPRNEVHLHRMSFLKFKDEPPYDDLIQFYFECPECKQLFSFGCETYHGSGGDWKPIERTGS